MMCFRVCYFNLSKRYESVFRDSMCCFANCKTVHRDFFDVDTSLSASVIYYIGYETGVPLVPAC